MFFLFPGVLTYHHPNLTISYSFLVAGEAKKLVLDHDVFAASRENYSSIASNCGVQLGFWRLTPLAISLKYPEFNMEYIAWNAINAHT